MYKYNRPILRTLINAVMLAALLVGLIPPPLITGTVTSVADLTGFHPLTTKALSGLGQALPQPTTAQAAPDEGLPEAGMAAPAAQISVSGVVNTYAPVTNMAGNDVTIGATTGAATPFAAGDKALLIQMTGVPPSQGGNLGVYEMLDVTGVSGSTITLSGISNSYDFATEAVQLVRVPSDTTITVTGQVAARTWDGSTGGIVALAGDTLTLNADIDASNAGFQADTYSGGSYAGGLDATSASFAATTGTGSTDGRGNAGGSTPVQSSPTKEGGDGGSGGGGIGGAGGSGGAGGAGSFSRDDGHDGGDGGGTGQGGAGGIYANSNIGSGTPLGTVNAAADGAGTSGGAGGAEAYGNFVGGNGTLEGGAGSGGGGGVIGGGGGGGGGGFASGSSFGNGGGAGGGGGVAGGGGGGGGSRESSNGYLGVSGGGGGGVGSVGSGGNAVCDDSCAGAGGGSYGGGGGAASAFSGGDDACGGGGGGSWSGGGGGGLHGTNPFACEGDGGDGNAPTSAAITDADHYLNYSNPRLMMGGAGGAANCADGGAGGGIVFLQFDSVVGNGNSIVSNGETPAVAESSSTCATAPYNVAGSGGGGAGGGGQMRLSVVTFSNVTVTADGGTGGTPAATNQPVSGANNEHAGVSGGGGGAGGVWFDGATVTGGTTNTGGQTPTIPGVAYSVAGGPAGPIIINPKNNYDTGTSGGGGNGLIAVSSPGTITIVKNTDGSDATFDFTSGDVDLDAVSITTSSGTGSSATFTKTAGTYTISEDALAGWTLNSIAFSGDTDSGSSSSGSTANIDLDAGENIIVTFSNGEDQPEGTIQIVKNTSGGDGSFGFTSSHATLDDVHLTTVGGTASSAVMRFNAGSYTIAEDSLVGWTLSSLTCTGDADGGNVIDQTNRQVTIDLDENEDIICTFTNTAESDSASGSNVLTVTKTIDGAGSGPFDIEIVGPNGYSTNAQIDDGDVLTFTNLVSGIYTVTESTPAGWTTSYTATTSAGSVSSTTSGVVMLTNESTIAPFTADISGKVFRDFNSDGQITANGTVTDTGVSGIIVTVHDPAGNAVGSAISDANGNYTVSPTGAGPYRVLFSNLPDGYEPATHGPTAASGTNGTSVQFINTLAQATGVNLGLHIPEDYCQDNPDFCTNIAINGSATDPGSPYSNLFRVDYGATASTGVTAKGATGSTYGLAYDRDTGVLYTSAYLKRHVGLGPDGLGAIYAIPNAATAGPFAPANLLVDLAAAGINLGQASVPTVRGLSSATTPSHDATVYGLIGKVGLGDIDLDQDTNILWAINLYERTLLRIPTSSPTAVSAIPIPNPGCQGGEYRPFATKAYRGKVYIGLVCDAQSSNAAADLDAYVYEYNPDSGVFTSRLKVDLDYVKGSAYSLHAGCDPVGKQWYPWMDTLPVPCGASSFDGTSLVVRPQPMLSDIEFDNDGSLILGFRDRLGDQGGYKNYGTNVADSTTVYSVIAGGDVLRAANVNGTFVLETNGTVGGLSGGVGNSQGPGGGEFYLGDSQAAIGHPETAVGGLALLPGSAELLITAYDPTGTPSTGGPSFLSNVNGAQRRGIQVHTNFTGYAGKANGLGDVELLCDAAPIEIGNRVWDDLDGDGEQDAGEPGLGNLTITLTGADGTNTTTNTDSNGLYYFGDLNPYTAYTLTMAAPAGYEPAAANQIALSGAGVQSNHAISDTIDSDAALVNGVATIYYSTGGPGENNHGLDFGFTQPVTGQVDIVNEPPEMPALAIDKMLVSPANGVAAEGETVIFSLTISNTGSVTMTELNLSDTFDANYLQFSSASIAPDTTGADTLTWVGDSVAGTGSLLSVLPLGPGDSFVVTVEFVAVKP